MAGDQLKFGDGKFVVTDKLPLFSPQVVGVGIILAVGKALGVIVAVAVVEHPPPVTVTVYVPEGKPVGFCGFPAMAGDQLNVGVGKLVVTVILPLFCPQVVGVGTALAVGNVLGEIVAVAVVEQPPPVTVTV